MDAVGSGDRPCDLRCRVEVRRVVPVTFSSAAYWETRYASGGNSGDGSRGDNARLKADYLNRFVKDYEVRSVVEFGCGDGWQLSLANYPDYLGLDVSETAVEKCRTLFALDTHKRFYRLPTAWPVVAQLSLSLDVIYHLVEDSVYLKHLDDVFGAATRFVILYTTDSDVVDPSLYTAEHVKHRPVCRDVKARFPGWLMMDCEPEPNGVDFYWYQRR